MKKLTISVLLASALLGANDYKYEVSPMVGYLWNSTASESTSQINGATGGVNDHAVLGVDVKMNAVPSSIKPEFSILYGRDHATGISGTTSVVTTMLNGVYELKNISSVTPFVKAGFGYEWYKDTHASDYDGYVLDAGVGATVDITETVSLKLEGLYMYKINNNSMDGSNGEIHNIAALIGLNFKFGAIKTEQKVSEPAHEAPVKVVDEPKKPVEVLAVATVVADSDHDGVIDTLDKCPDTPQGFEVDAQGCPLKMTLPVHFGFDSTDVDEAGMAKVSEFSAFLKKSPAYDAIIIGHTDSTGTVEYNQKLSERRAEKVKSLLVEQNIAIERLTTRGYGEMKPNSTNKTSQGRAQNRRIEVELVK